MVGHADETQTSTSTPGPAQADHVADCLRAVEDYRGHRLSKWSAIALISTAISAAAAGTTSEQRTAAGEHYLVMLDEHDRVLADAHTRGRQGPRPVDDANYGADEDAAGEDRSRRSLSRSCSPHSKRPKTDETLYAWKIQERIAPPALPQNLEQTRSMVQNYTADLKHSLWSLQSSSSLPPFPRSEWKHVLSGTAVNLDVVFSGLFSTLAEDKATASIGDFDLSIGGGKPSKVVQSHGDWTIAWNATFAAILCAFPHRALELRIYSEYILQFFGAFPHSHFKVINLDKAIRRYAGEVKHIELADVGCFRHLEAHYLQDDGAGNQTTGCKEKETGRASKRSNETCRQWNSGVCNRRASECRFRHLCTRCRANHPSTECTKKD
jgi:hypothetical protein